MAWSKLSRHARGYGKEWDKLRAFVMAMDNWLCQACLKAGRVTPATDCDHIVPKAKGGTDDAANCQALCRECNQAKARQESADARGVTLRPKLEIGLDGWPV